MKWFTSLFTHAKPEDIAQDDLRNAKIQLLDANKNKESWDSQVKMLEARVARLTAVVKGSASSN